MYLLLNTFLLVSFSIPGILADFLGPTYPFPQDLTSERSLSPGRMSLRPWTSTYKIRALNSKALPD